MSALLIDGTLWATVVTLAAMTWLRGRPVFTAAARGGAMDFLNIIPRITLGVVGSGSNAAIIPSEIITGWLTHVPAKWNPVRRQGHASTLESTAFPIHMGSLR
jgi:hypothetical protein